MNVIETIKARGSVRTYDKEVKRDYMLLEAKIAIINSTTGPFGNQIKVSLVKSTEDSSEMKLGTYGMIKNAEDYLVVTCNQESNVLIDLGYLFEEVILYATSLGLGTVWMAGTFSRKHFKDAIEFKQDEILPIVSPVGIKSERKSFVDKYIAKPKTHVRKEFGVLFTDSNGTSLEYDQSIDYMQALEMVRLAPSGMNKQPWRVVVDGDNFHFYTFAEKRGVEIDLGIALNHFDKTMNQLGHTGNITITPNDYKDNYMFTWSLEK